MRIHIIERTYTQKSGKYFNEKTDFYEIEGDVTTSKAKKIADKKMGKRVYILHSFDTKNINGVKKYIDFLWSHQSSNDPTIKYLKQEVVSKLS